MFRVFLQDPLIGDLVGTAYLEHLTLIQGQVPRLHEILEHVFHSDGLCHGPDPYGSGHDRKPLHKAPDHLERKASRPDDDGRPELYCRNAGIPEDLPHFLPAGKVR